MEIVLIAWRNLWRNKRRTLITAASVFFAIWFALIMRSFQLGSYELMVNNIVHAYSGYFQVHAKGYWDDKVLNNGFVNTNELELNLQKTEGVAGYAPRLETFALASYGMQTKGVVVNGVDPDAENGLTSLQKKMVTGQYLKPDDSGALISQRLAKYLKIGVGDTLVIIGQGYHGATAAGIFPVRGIVRFPSPDLDSRLVYLSLPVARNLLNARDMLTSIAFNVEDPGKYKTVAKHVNSQLDNGLFEVMTWEEMMPDVVQQIRADSASGLIMLGILYMIVGFGIFGTMLMMLNERSREFGMMIAIGMQKGRLMLIVITETLFLGLLGIVSGVMAAIPPIYYFYIHPIPLTGDMAESTIRMGFEPLMPTAWESSYFIAQSLVVLIIILMVMFLPVMRIRRLTVIKAMRH
ncbi:MAG: ABC transporter permease [Bacteroidales bacterium]|nr:ABC transporter permease [Bacteroidales bacterium]